MQYRRLGQSGLKLSELSLGAWVTFGNQLDVRGAVQCMSAEREAGVNFFDNVEVYAGGQAERIMGAALRELGWPRSSYVVSTKFFWGLNGGPNERNTLNRKYLLGAIDGSLERLGLPFVDLVFCHHAAGGDRAGDARHRAAGQGALLGHLRVERRRDQRGVGDRGPASSAQAR